MSDNNGCAELEDTMEQEPIIANDDSITTDDDNSWVRKKPVFKKQELVVGKDGQSYLVIRSLERRRFYVDANNKLLRRSRDTDKQTLRRHYRVVVKSLLLVENELVNPKLALRISEFSPGDTETEIHGLYRKSMWSFLAAPVAGLVAWLVGLVFYWFYVVDPAVLLSIQLTLVFFIVLSVIGGLHAWLRWAPYFYLITNERLTLQYKPPLLLPGYVKPVLLRDVTSGFTARDESWVVNWLGEWSFGNVESDTAADVGDEWMNKMRFIRYHDLVADLLNNLRTR
ncbi:TPA: hypothetical protein DCF80_01660 [Candidatus Saccharibacteria bacterium]|nr:hypothetical protein [Candidatus Saccharibacteria bacterium]HRK41146.1 hypothetical protein [Candidatus Saccharibacteria bacterium]